jgi:alanyl-tRNA synthetase
MTTRLYYTDSFLLDFVARVTEVREVGGRTAAVLDSTAFYPTSGGQTSDTGLLIADGREIRVAEVAEDENGEVLHFLEAPLETGVAVQGRIDRGRRLDHMQQHTGQHVLSAVFVELYGMQTLSFHMGDESCTIDLDTRKLTAEQAREAERRANEIVRQDRTVRIHFKARSEAEALGVRKIAPELGDPLRLIEIEGVEYNACGGTHVARTGEIGAILLRKSENVRQGARVEFVCGERAVRTARHDFEALTGAAALLSTHIHELPAQIGKLLDENKAGGKREKALLEEVAECEVASLLAAAPEKNGIKIVRRVFNDRDAGFIRLLAQKIAARATGSKAVALLGATLGQPTLVFAQPAGGPFDLGSLMKDLLAKHGGRGGGSRELAQGGVGDAAKVEAILEEAEGFVIANL